MTISVGDRLPEGTFLKMTENGPEAVSIAEFTAGRKVVIFGVPGAFTPTCHSAHVPSFVRVMDDLKAKGVDEVVCVSVNDPHVMRAWGDATGGAEAGITFLADPDCSVTEAIGMRFDAPPAGLLARSKRYALAAEDGVVTVWHPEPATGCSISGGEAMVEAL